MGWLFWLWVLKNYFWIGIECFEVFWWFFIVCFLYCMCSKLNEIFKVICIEGFLLLVYLIEMYISKFVW